MCFQLSQRLQCAHLFITTYFILILTSSKKTVTFVPAYLHPPYLTQTCFISCVYIFIIVFTVLLKTEIRESFQILPYPLHQQLISKYYYSFFLYIPQQPSSLSLLPLFRFCLYPSLPSLLHWPPHWSLFLRFHCLQITTLSFTQLAHIDILIGKSFITLLSNIFQWFLLTQRIKSNLQGMIHKALHDLAHCLSLTSVTTII